MKLIKLFKNKHELVVTFYLVYFVAFVFYSIFSAFEGYIFAQKNAEILSESDFELVNIAVNEDGSYIATNEDPQLILKKPINGLRTLSYTLETAQPSGEACVFYAKQYSDGYSTRKAVWAERKEQKHSYVFPFQKITHFRIDPTNISKSSFSIKNISINHALPFYEYLIPSYTEIFFFLIIPLLAASFASFIKTLITVALGKSLEKW